MPDSQPSAEFRPCPLPRRLGAMVYDALVLIALWMAGGVLVVAATGGAVASGSLPFQIYLAGLAYGYFWLSWRRNGQTLGMRAWRIRLDSGARPFGAARTLARLLGAVAAMLTLGLGYLWSLGRPDRRAWPDLASGSRLVVAATRRGGSERSGA